MLKFWFHHYTLQPMTHLGSLAAAEPRRGALLKIQWPNGKIGYSDLFPWTELGDADLETQLHEISKSHLSHLVEQSIWLAKRDADLRADGKNALKELGRVKNHFLINDPARVEDATLLELKSAGFTTVKIKMGRDLEQEAKFLDKILKQHQQLVVRLDFNASLSFARFEKFISAIPLAQRARIEFVEDPFPFDLENWTKANALVPLALDQEYDKVQWEKLSTPPFKVLIIKPARQDVPKAVEHANKFGLKMVITSSLDHPLGMAHAAWVAAEIRDAWPNAVLDCGCLSLRAYRSNDFAMAVTTQGPYVAAIRGHGVGFDYLLEKVAWNPIPMSK